jgi:hypothetical protein
MNIQNAPAPVAPVARQGLGLLGLIGKAYNAGRIICKTLSHFEAAPWNPVQGQWGYKQRTLGSIISQMMPGQTAKCSCEQAACKAAWTRTADGQLTSEYVLNGTFQKGIKGHCLPGEQVKQVMHLNYRLTADNFTTLSNDFPSYYFVTGARDHDHPVAHTRTKFTTRMVVDALRKGCGEKPRRYLDLYGNPAANRHFNQVNDDTRIDTAVELITPKDFIRAAQKWGDWAEDTSVYEGSMRDFTTYPTEDVAARMRTYDGFVAFHTLYYMQKDELATLLRFKRGTTLTATVHRFKGKSGTLNNGEQTYTKFIHMGKWWVRQVNVKTGEAYEHPDIEWLFENDSCPGPNGHGIGWTTNILCPDTFEIVMVSVPNQQVLMSPRHLAEEVVAVIDNVDDEVAVTGKAHVCIGGTRTALAVDAPVAFKQMRLHVSGKARTAEQFKDHLAATKRAMIKHKEDSGNAATTAIASFMVDFEADSNVTRQVIGNNQESVKSLELILRGHAPLSCRNAVDKLLALGIIAISVRTGSDKSLSRALRAGRDLLQSNGTNVNI